MILLLSMCEIRESAGVLRRPNLRPVSPNVHHSFVRVPEVICQILQRRTAAETWLACRWLGRGSVHALDRLLVPRHFGGGFCNFDQVPTGRCIRIEHPRFYHAALELVCGLMLEAS